MLKLMTVSIAVSMVAMTVTAVDAQVGACSALLSQGCACAAAVVPGALGSLVSSQGDVVVSGRTNFSPANQSAGLGIGDGIVIGPGGSASIAFGPSCQAHTFAGPASASITQMGPCACLMVNDTPTPTPTPAGDAALLGALVGGPFLLIQNNRPLSP